MEHPEVDRRELSAVVAAITGKLGEAMEGGFRLDNPAVQVFEKKPKPDAATTAPPPVSAPAAPPPVAPASSTAAPASPASLKPFGGTLHLKATVERRGA